VSGTDGLSVFQVESVSFGGFAVPKLHFHQADKSCIGTGFLSRFNVTLDFLNHEMHLEKGKQFHRSDSLDMSGLHIVRKKGKTIIHSIDAGSPADLQGMKPKDVIEKIGVLDASQTRLFVLRKLLSSEGKEVSVTLVRSKRSIPWPLSSIPVVGGASAKEEKVVRLSLKNWRKDRQTQITHETGLKKSTRERPSCPALPSYRPASISSGLRP
jgi:hypothetical protein